MINSQKALKFVFFVKVWIGVKTLTSLLALCGWWPPWDQNGDYTLGLSILGHFDSRWIFTWLRMCHRSELSFNVIMSYAPRELPKPLSRSHSVTSPCPFY
jgi:hypothetical protein